VEVVLVEFPDRRLEQPLGPDRGREGERQQPANQPLFPELNPRTRKRNLPDVDLSMLRDYPLEFAHVVGVLREPFQDFFSETDFRQVRSSRSVLTEREGQGGLGGPERPWLERRETHQTPAHEAAL